MNPKFYTSGSSNGTAAGIASGLAPYGIGTDGGGSIRNPAAYCGIFGLKPTHGRYSLHNSFSNGFIMSIFEPFIVISYNLYGPYRALKIVPIYYRVHIIREYVSVNIGHEL